ncbi:hypothetical protein LJB98_02825 [Bacteroidales bacterium OttesenSCG-928-M11]|nr:hypothetical protein [Bacteroidales bacterium OttesenSCG-928-M11]
MLDDIFFGLNQEEEHQENYPEYFYNWDNSLTEGKTPGYFESEQLSHIVEIYFQENENEKARKTILYSLEKYPNDDDLLYEIMIILSDYALWNDLFILTEKHRNSSVFWIDGHRLEALLHLGMEEEAFHFFSEIKRTYTKKSESLFILYQAMGESLIEVGLNDAAVLVLDEGIKVLGEKVEFLWLQLESYLALRDKEKVVELGNKIGILTPFDSLGWHRLGLYYSEIQEYERAIEAFEFAQNLNFSDSKKNLYELIKAYQSNGNPSMALEKTKEFLHLYPDNYFVNISAATLSAELEEWRDAIEYIDKVIALKPEMGALYLYKSSYLLKIGEIKKAKATLLDGISASNNSDELLLAELNRLNQSFPNE